MLSHIIASLVSSSSLHIHGPPQRLNTSLRYDLCLRSESPAGAKRVNRNLSRGVGGARQRTTFPCLSNWVREVRTRRGLFHSLAVMFAALRAHYSSFVIAPSSSELGQHLCHLPACALTSLTHHPAPPHPQCTQTQPPMDTHCRNVTFNGQCHQSHAYMQQSPTQGAVLRV